ncbi:putative membrane protein [Candidatus Phytoplasma solani]|uniref:hypothetical protein n=1 Tax=Candidatus Phytoplasma solani TaxID=69896 RepID=UPI0032DADB14
MKFKSFYYRYKQIIVFFLLFLSICCIFALSFLFTKKLNNKKSSNDIKKDFSVPNILEEKEISFEELDSFQTKMTQQYPEEATKIYKYKDINGYYSGTDNHVAHALIFINKGYSSSNIIKEPLCIFIPRLNEENIIKDEKKYFDSTLEELKQYCIENNKNIYINKIKNLPQVKNQPQQNIEANQTQNNTEDELNFDFPYKEIELETLDSLFTNEYFKKYYKENNMIAIASGIDRLSQEPQIYPDQTTKTVIFAKEDFPNSVINNNTDDKSVLIFIPLTKREQIDKIFKEDDSSNPVNQIFNKKYEELTLNDIQNSNRKGILIFKIKYADYLDKVNNPKSQSKLD